MPLLSAYPDMSPFLQRVQALRSGGSLFDPAAPVYVARSPGRLDLMGGNDDYTGGLVFELTLREATRVAAQPRTDRQVIISNPQAGEMGWCSQVVYSLADLFTEVAARPLAEIHRMLQTRAAESWTAYVIGALYLLGRDFPERVTHGLSVYVESDVPIGKGVSSSAALEVASLKAIGGVYNLSFEGVDLATRCQWVENAIAQSASGVMDQISVVLGDQDHFVPLVCQPCLPEPLVRLPYPLRTWGIDSGVRHEVAGLEYERARAATFMGYQILSRAENLPITFVDTGPLARWTDPRWDGYLANLAPSEFRARFEACLPERVSGAEFTARYPVHVDPYTTIRSQVDYPVRAAVRYAVEENYRVRLFVDLLVGRSGHLSERTLALLGELMVQSHQGYTECGLGSSATDRLVELVQLEGPANGLYGAKITGGGAGGTVAVLGRDTSAAQAAFERVVASYSEETGYSPYVFEGSSPGADRFGVLTLPPAST